MSTSTPAAGAPARPAGSRVWATVRLVGSLGLGLLALYVVAGRRDELSVVSSYLDTINPLWVVVAVALETVSIAAFAAVQRRLARSGGATMRFGTLFGITLAGNSITNSLPAGPAWASYFSFRQYRRYGADATLSAWILVGLFLVASVTLAILATAGLIVASTTGSGSFGVANTVVSVVFGVVAVAGLVAVVLHRRGALESTFTRTLRLAQKVTRRPAGDPAEIARSIAERLGSVRPSRAATAAALGWAMLNWTTDLGCLVAAFWAVGVGVPWSGILLAYGAGQLAANLPVTPGGLGVVEGSLAIALEAYGGAQASTVAAILLYRIVSFWLLLPAGWIAWIALHLAERRSPSGAPALQTAPVEAGR